MIEFKEPTSKGRKTAKIEELVILQPVYNTGWKRSNLTKERKERKQGNALINGVK